MKIKAFRRVELTTRDLFLLHELYRNVVMSFPQVWRTAFAKVAKSTALNRLAHLEAAGVLRRFRVPKFPAGREESEILVVFQITRLGIRELLKRQNFAIEKAEPLRLHGYTLHHDVLLVDVMEALEKRAPGARVTHGRLIPASLVAEAGIEPDAVLASTAAQGPMAVELELTAKTDKRYREIVLRYRLARVFSQVLYVIREERVRRKLERVLGHPLVPLGAESSGDRFLFVFLRDLFLAPKVPSPVLQSSINQQTEVTHE